MIRHLGEISNNVMRYELKVKLTDYELRSFDVFTRSGIEYLLVSISSKIPICRCICRFVY
jgi:hypothetical protein